MKIILVATNSEYDEIVSILDCYLTKKNWEFMNPEILKLSNYKNLEIKLFKLDGEIILISKIGVGKVESAFRTEKTIDAALEILEQFKTDNALKVFNAGVCGIRNGIEHKAYRVDRVFNADFDTEAFDGKDFKIPCIELTKEKQINLATADTVCGKEKLKESYDLYDMEGYSVARVCEWRKLPCVLIKAPTDAVEENDSKRANDYIFNMKKACRQIADYLIKYL